MSSAPQFSLGNFIPENITLPKNETEFYAILQRILENQAKMINRKDTGQYETVEIQNNQTFPGSTPQQKRYVFRKIYEVGAIATGATSNIAHGITGVTIFTRIYGTVITNVVDYRPLPFISTVALNQNTSLLVAGANIQIINGAGAPPITSGFVVLEFLKQS